MRSIELPQIHKIIETCNVADSEMLESETVEFKEFANIRSLHNSKELAEELSALANKNGGVVIVGVRDGNNIMHNNYSEQLVGFEVGDVIEIEQRLKGKLKPNIEIKAEYIEVLNKDFLVIHVPNRGDTLVSTSSGKYCIRDGRSSRPMSPDEIKPAINKLHNSDWTADILEKTTLSALDSESVSASYDDYCSRKNYSKDELPSVEAYLEAIGATTNGLLTKSGLLFLGKTTEIRKWLGTYEYRFSWKTRAGSLLINDVWEDNLWKTNLKARQLFGDCNKSVTFTFQNKEYESLILDHEAFHEGFMNALVHRDYSQEGMVAVDFDSNAMTIINPGVFFDGVSAENIAIIHPKHRNKALAKLLMNFQLVDRAGMGIKRMGLGSLKYGRSFPKFKESIDTVEVELSAKATIPAIFVLTQNFPDRFGLLDLVIANSLYRIGHVLVPQILKLTRNIKDSGWEAIKESVERHDYFELCGNKDGIYIRVSPKWNSYFDVKKTLKITSTSDKHIKLFDFLIEYNSASNEEVTSLLKHKSTTHTSKFLKDAMYTTKTGRGRSTRWLLTESAQ